MYIISTTDNRLSMIISFYGNIKDFWAASHSFGDRNMAPFSGPFYVNGPQNCMTCNDKPSRVSKLVPCRWQLARLSCYSQRHTHTHTPTVSGVKMGAEKEKKEEGLLGRKGTSGFSQPYCDSEVFEEWEIISNSHTDLSMYTQGSDCLHLTRVVCRNKWLNLVFTLNPTPPPSIFKPVFGTHKMNILSFYQGFNLSLRLGQ